LSTHAAAPPSVGPAAWRNDQPRDGCEVDEIAFEAADFTETPRGQADYSDLSGSLTQARFPLPERR